MARGKKTGGNDFKPGNRAAEGKSLPADIKETRKLRTADLERIIHTTMYLTDAELAATESHPDTPQIVKFVCSIVRKGITDGDPVRLNHLAIWILGKPNTEPPPAVPYLEIHRTDGTVVRMGQGKEEMKK